MKTNLSEILQDNVRDMNFDFNQREIFLNITSASDQELLENGLVRVDKYNKLRYAVQKAHALLDNHLNLAEITWE